MKSKFKIVFSNTKDFIGITIGCAIFGISYSWFLIPFKVSPGGVGGIATVLFHLFNFPAGISMVIINVPLFVIAWVFLGKKFGFRSFYGMLTGALFIDLLSPAFLYNHFPFFKNLINTQHWAFTDNIFLASIAGSVLLGIGLGIIFRFYGSTGGTDIPVAVLKQYTGVSMGTGYWFIESLIIFIIGLVFKDLNLIIWGYLNLFITTKIVDLTAEGLPYVKGAYIVSDNEESIKVRILDELDRGLTVFLAQGGYSGKSQNVLFCAINRNQITQLKRIVKEEDSDAFVLLVDVNDVLGNGFKSRMIDFQKAGS